MGFGHRVYKNRDPRATVMKQTRDEVLKELGINDPQPELAMAWKRLLSDRTRTIERSLYPNVDFYFVSSSRRSAFQPAWNTVIFALGADRGLDLPLERNALQPVQDWPPAPLHTAMSRVTSPSRKIAQASLVVLQRPPQEAVFVCAAWFTANGGKPLPH